LPDNNLNGAKMNLFTIGYEGLDQRQFMAHLAHNKISVVADVRHLPLSRKKGFSKSSLAEMLNENDIEYISLRDLGTSKDMRNTLYATKNYAAFFKDYKKLIADKKESLDKILNFLEEGQNVSLLCFERDPDLCHRKIVAEEIRKRNGNGLKINHIKPI
jgi:uncharacterized protein (DUF488 family)